MGSSGGVWRTESDLTGSTGGVYTQAEGPRPGCRDPVGMQIEPSKHRRSEEFGSGPVLFTLVDFVGLPSSRGFAKITLRPETALPADQVKAFIYF